MPVPTLRCRLAPALLVGLLGLSAALPALANPGAVARILRESGQSGVARGPNTVNDATKQDLQELAQQTAAKTGAKVYFVIVGDDSDTAPYSELYSQLGMRGKDVLVVSNGPKWDVRVAALTAEQKKTILNDVMAEGGKPLERMERLTDRVTSALAQTRATVGAGRMSWNEFEAANAGKGWDSARMSREYKNYMSKAAAGRDLVATTGVPARTESGGGAWWGFGFFALVIAALVGFVVYRRRQRDTLLTQELKQALALPEATMSEVYLSLDGLEDHPEFGRTLERATAVTEKLDALKEAAPTREGISRARALADEARQVRGAFDQLRRSLPRP